MPSLPPRALGESLSPWERALAQGWQEEVTSALFPAPSLTVARNWGGQHHAVSWEMLFLPLLRLSLSLVRLPGGRRAPLPPHKQDRVVTHPFPVVTFGGAGGLVSPSDMGCRCLLLSRALRGHPPRTSGTPSGTVGPSRPSWTLWELQALAEHLPLWMWLPGQLVAATWTLRKGLICGSAVISLEVG